ncbi:MAG: hypothetical protein V2A76_13195 [Planctomycetota bacterium]
MRSPGQMVPSGQQSSSDPPSDRPPDDPRPDGEAGQRDAREAPESAFLELQELFREVQAEVEAQDVTCDMRGVCCDFERSGHVLMATELEVEHARRTAGPAVPEAPVGACPFWVSGRCDHRSGRPLGCRVYFCAPGHAERMGQIAEQYHRRVVHIHERHGIRYHYGRFVTMIRRRGDEA